MTSWLLEANEQLVIGVSVYCWDCSHCLDNDIGGLRWF